MSGWRRPTRALAALPVVWGLLGAALAQDPAAEATAHMNEGRYDLALEAVELVPDPAVRAEWRFHVLHTGGDLPGALAAARAGLEQHPQSPWLLENAARTAVALGLGRESVALAGRLLALEGLDEGVRTRGRTLLAEAEGVLELEARGAAGVGRARTVSLLALAAALAALALLARGGRSQDVQHP